MSKHKILGALLGAVLLTAITAGSAYAAPPVPVNTQYQNDTSPGLDISAGVGPRFDQDVPGVGGIFPTVDDFKDVTLRGVPMLTSANIPPFTVIDDSGTSAGWNVTLVMTDFQDGTGSDCSTGATHTIDASTTSMNAPYVDIGTDDTDITGVAGHEFIDFTSANKIVVATATHGAGTYLVSPQLLKFVVPTTTFAGTYCSFATIAIASGP